MVGLQDRISLDTQTGCQPERHSSLAGGRPGEKPQGKDCDKARAQQAGEVLRGTLHGASARKAARRPNVRPGTGAHKVPALYWDGTVRDLATVAIWVFGVQLRKRWGLQHQPRSGSS